MVVSKALTRVDVKLASIMCQHV